MASQLDIPKLVQLVADAYTVEELRGFLADYFTIRLDHIIIPEGSGLIEVVRKVVDHFDRRGALQDLVREIQKDRPGVIDLVSILLPPEARAPGSTGTPPPAPSAPTRGHVDIERDELDFYFVIEPDRRTVPPPSVGRSTQSIYVRIPIAASATRRVVQPRALSLTVDRSGSMSGAKTEVARGAADYLLEMVEGSSDKVAIVAFDDVVEVPVGLTSVPRASTLKARLRTLSARGETDLFAAWQRSVDEVRPAGSSFDRRVVLITDGMLNRGMTDPVRFECEVRQVWMREQIATTCISMGDSWNVDLLNKLASAGGGGLHFMKDRGQAEQALHEAFHAARGVVASNLRAELEPLGSARVTQVQGSPTSLGSGSTSVHSIATQLRANVEENLVLRLEFMPSRDQAVEVLRCKLLFEDPATGLDRELPEKVLRMYSDELPPGAGLAIVNQGVVCTVHTVLSHQRFKQALAAFLRENAAAGQHLLEQSRFSLKAAEAPPGYRLGVSMQQRRIEDLERFEGQVPVEYIKEKYIEELTHRDVVWMKLSEILDRLLRLQRDGHIDEVFHWADRMVDEFSAQLPMLGDPRRDTSDFRPQGNAPRRDLDRGFWMERAYGWLQRGERSRDQGADVRTRDLPPRIATVAGACFGFERWRQGTREELAELMEAYLEGLFGRDW